MNIHILGTASGHTSYQRQHYSLFFEEKNQTMLVDCGCHVSQWLLKNNIDADVPDALYLTHAHSDHIGQFHNLIQSLWLRKRKKPLFIYGPGKLIDFLQKHMAMHLLFPEMLGFAIEWNHLHESETCAINSWRCTPFATNHLQSFQMQFATAYPEVCFECLGFSLQTPRSTICLSSDIKIPVDLAPTLQSKSHDILICEMAHFETEELFNTLMRFDLRKLILLHYGDEFVGKEAMLRDQAKDIGCSFTLHLATDNFSLNLTE
ncbi:MAG: MBL fold metallo-hydrolase [Verrucomicrobiota bacterium]